MIVTKHFQRRFRNAEPGADGSSPTPDIAVDAAVAASAIAAGADAPVIDNSIVPPAATPAAPAADPLAGLKAAIDNVGKDAVTDGQPRDPLGRFSPTTPQPTPAPSPAPAAPAATPAPAAAKPEDDLTPPEGMSERAAARFQALAERAKIIPVLEQRATEATTALESVRKLVGDSGLAPQEFTEMLDMARAFKSGNPQDLQTALKQLDGLRADVAQRLGQEVPGVDLLAGHDDLQNKVANMLLSREDALEIARLRTKGNQADTFTREQQEAIQHRRTVEGAAAAMDAALQARANTPGHDSKIKAVATYFAKPENMQAFVKTYTPDQWPHVVGLMYDNVSVQVAAAPPAGPQPLRAGNMRAGAPVVNGPVTAMSALENALAAAGLQ